MPIQHTTVPSQEISHQFVYNWRPVHKLQFNASYKHSALKSTYNLIRFYDNSGTPDSNFHNSPCWSLSWIRQLQTR